MEKAPQSQTIKKRLTIALIVWCVAGFVSLGLMWREHDAAFHLALLTIGIPFSVACFYVGFKYRTFFKSKSNKPGVVVYSLQLSILSFIVTFLGSGVLLGVNAVLPPQKTLMVDGTITDKYVTGGRSHYYCLVVRWQGGPKDMVTLDVPRCEYDLVAVGAHFQQEWKSGPLGLLYQWRYW